MDAKISLSLFTSLMIPLSFLLIISKASNIPGAQENVTRSDFPDDFLFGVATSAYQIEGAVHEDGRGLSNWDAFVQIKGTVENGDTADIADDHYHRYLEDIELMHSLGLDAYRFSISWTRILPRGRFGEVNLDGITFYSNIIDNLLLRGIKPVVTIHHEDYPLDLLQRYGAWLSPMMQDDFVYFAEICFKHFGDRVKHWITINEPNQVSQFAYMWGVYPPGHCSPPFGICSAGNSDTEPLIAMHNMLLAHAKAVKLYRQKFQPQQGGMIGIVAHAFMYEPLTDNENDTEAASRGLAFNVAWPFDPLVFGDYPPEMRLYLKNELPVFTAEETELVKGSIDFIGINHYSTMYAKDCLSSDSRCSPVAYRPARGFVDFSTERDGVPIGDATGMGGFFVVPRGIEEIVDYLKKRYNNKPIFILENGYSFPLQQIGHADLQNDVKRIEYHKQYLAFLARAVRNGADVRGYFIWSLMDNFEWSSGYAIKFGLYGVDPMTLSRSARASSIWYRNFLRKNDLVKKESRISSVINNRLVPHTRAQV